MATLGSAHLPAEASVPSRVSTAPVTKLAPRHSALVRVTHWITTLCFFALFVTGIEIVISHPRFYWGETGTVLTTPLFQLPIALCIFRSAYTALPKRLAPQQG